ncbi:hypothetical protein AVEN_259971-1 [Araneus ventricosus]|uniref:RNase H type-1 domain-containing protein n=1 Tax=Araneus ventricosus TaxID=182803 RepID=A0A4Y2NUS7_ARAVE|nr:hypothetical protein AVEN_259971-1 [Araneus ventricosus]
MRVTVGKATQVDRQRNSLRCGSLKMMKREGESMFVVGEIVRHPDKSSKLNLSATPQTQIAHDLGFNLGFYSRNQDPLDLLIEEDLNIVFTNLKGVVEKALLYGAAVWGRALTIVQILKLHSIQRMFLLKLSRSNKTTPTNALNVIIGIPPLHVVIKSLVTRFNIWKLRSDRHIELTDPIKLDFYRDIKGISSNGKIVTFEKDFACDYVVYIDVSKIDGNVGFSVCIFERNSLLPVLWYKLNILNSVFQAELAAIDFAAGWVLDKNVKIKIFTDSKSSIEALRSANIKSNFVLSVKEHLYKDKDLVSLAWVKAHPGNPGNELADHFAKIASFCGTEMFIPTPYSFVKRTCNDLSICEWNIYWTNSVSGQRTKDFFPSLNVDLLIYNK